MIGCFDGAWPNAFGDPRANLRRLIATGNVVAVRVQIWWSYSHIGVPLDLLKKRIPLYEALAKAYPSVKFYISPSCEYQRVSIDLVKRWVHAIRKLAPHCTPVLSPMPGAPTVPGVLIEEHGTKSTTRGNQGASWDGNATFDGNAEAWNGANAGEYRLAWGYRYNMSVAGNEATPNRRTYFPDSPYIQSLDRLLYPRGELDKPTFAGEVRPIIGQKTNIYKTHAEDNGTDPRRNKPCLIIPTKAPYVDIITPKGDSLGKLAYYDDYLGNRHRYYAGWKDGINLMGYRIEKLSRTVYFRAGKDIYGPVNPSFRAGPFL